MLFPGPLLEAKADGREKEEIGSMFQGVPSQTTTPHLSTSPNDNW